MTNTNIKVIELRNYLLKKGVLNNFINYFESNFIEPQNILGGYPLGQFGIDNTENRFCWIRGFEDMKTRSRFLRSFYEEGAIWKEYGPGANDMMINSDNVYLLRPLVFPLASRIDGFNSGFFNNNCKIANVGFYSANSRLNELIELFDSFYNPFMKSLNINVSYWISELGENDFPRLPVFQDKNLLVAIAFYETEKLYETKLKQIEAQMSPELKKRIPEIVTIYSDLVLHRV